ncbi:UDP-N-acetylmuramate dehydrogenase [Salipaludibacillus aurantiacus]|uniref:UDP-N-acetylenolpyruvoylglucosamine reductase n=1 Tax=Salipaludibacillus aurantiacus TaxID=1601833 RepID=A0A1H9QTD5_9BACI|nr:UDP-N-acetylmuramate dehydrogenase [Salipaludibacillus aurantiacus]SER63722.1 UDP-N-acetylmuramate dehydrogenase [Salipaludibacillus aurantiacus]
MDRVLRELKEELDKNSTGKAALDEPLKNHTTWKIGGPAALMIEPDSVESLKYAMAFIKEKKLPWFILGRGSNILVSDKGINGVVIKLGDKLASFKQEGDLISVGAGFSLIKLATIMSKKGYSGLEFAGGIPGSVGGAVFMNAGAHKSDISAILTKAYVLMRNGECTWLSNEELKFAYRSSVLQKNGGICISAEFQLNKGNTAEIRERLQTNKNYRKETQPWKDPCCGSVFRNPLPEHAGRLIEELGLKGYKVGGAQISERHANFIVNTGDASAEDILTLIDYIKEQVRIHYGIDLETEVEYIGD